MLHSKVDLGSKAEQCERILTLILGEVLLYWSILPDFIHLNSLMQQFMKFFYLRVIMQSPIQTGHSYKTVRVLLSSNITKEHT